MELEWRALAVALQAPSAGDRRISIADDILFRRERYRLFPNAAVNEMALEASEGIAEYTASGSVCKHPRSELVMLFATYQPGHKFPASSAQFAYATGPSYGLLLDQADPTG